MLSREDFYMIKQMRQQGAYIVDIATQIGCSERTVRRYLKYPEPPARKTRHKMVNVTNGAIVIHTQRLKSDPGGNLLS